MEERQSGWVSGETSFNIRGWTIDPARPEAACAVSLLVEGRRAATVAADQYRSNLKLERGGKNHGFSIMPPVTFLDGAEREMAVVNDDTGEVLVRKRAAFVDARLRAADGETQGFGAVTRLDALRVEGWVAFPGEAPEVVLLVDGGEAGRQKADIPTRVQPEGLDGEAGHGFAFRIPRRFFDGGPHRIAVTVEGEGGARLPAPAAELVLGPQDAPNLRGAFRLDGAGTVSGTVEDGRGGAGPVDLELWSGPALIGTRARVGVERRAEVGFDLGASPPVLAGRLFVRAVPDGATFPVEGGEALLTAFRVDAASIRDGVFEAEIVADTDAAGGILVLPGLDGRLLPQPLAAVRTGPASFVLRLPLAGAVRRIDLSWPDGHASLRGAPLDVPERTAAPSDAGAPWVDPFDPAVAAALAIARGSLLPAASAPGFSGYWSFDAATATARGWALDLRSPWRRLPLRLLVDGRPAAQGETGEREWLVAEPDGRGRDYPVCFRISLPHLTGSETVSVGIENGPLLAPSVRTLATQSVHVEGAVLHAVRRGFVVEVDGWARDRRRRGAPVRAELLCGERRAAAATAREAVGRADVSPVACLFAFRQALAEGELDGPLAVLLDGAVRLSVHLSDDAQASAAPLPEPARDGDVFEGVVEAVTATNVRGWARCREAPARAPELILHVDGRPFALGRCTARPSSAGAAIDGYGFDFELPPNLAVAKPVDCEIKAVRGALRIRGAQFRLGREKPGLAPASVPASNPFHAAAGPALQGGVSAIVLNLDGAALLSELFASYARVEAPGRVEWIVVDHGSTDASAEVCERARESGLAVRFMARGRNHSFSASNNWGARQASGDVLVFANNDLSFRTPFADEILRLLADAHVGAVGARLLDGAAPGGEDAPVQHLGVYINPLLQSGFIRPFEARAVEELAGAGDGEVSLPAATGAFLAMRRADFEALGGFEEGYHYGLEDVDLCLGVTAKLGKAVVRAHAIAIEHRRGHTRAAGMRTDPRHLGNRLLLNRRWGAFLRRRMRADVLARPAHWNGARPLLLFVLPAERPDAREAAQGLGSALQAALPVHVRFVETADVPWEEADILVVMDPAFDPGRAKAVRPHQTAAAWMRDNFERWAASPFAASCDFLWAPSERAAGLLGTRLGRRVEVLRNAADPARFPPKPQDAPFSRDYLVTKPADGSPGEAGLALRPPEIHGAGTAFGEPSTAARYAASRVVIDDAGWEARSWGGGGERLFEASAAGALVATSDGAGGTEAFGPSMPVWSVDEPLSPALNALLDDEPARAALAARLRERVLSDHTFANRANEVVRMFAAPARPIRFAIKCAARAGGENAWGDYHFAKSLARELAAKGHVARVDIRDRWYGGATDADDVAIVLRGLAAYKPKPHQRNLLWMLSHPHDVSVAEAAAYDGIFVASLPHARELGRHLPVPVMPLLQCTDTTLFRFEPERIGRRPDRAVFVGNSRGVFRDAVRWAVAAGLDIHVYGGGWESFLPGNMIKGDYVPNEVLGDLYASSRLVLCDHWDDMRRLGFLSNRAFDVLAVGGALLVDPVEGIEECLPGGFRIFRDAEELAALVRAPAEGTLDQRRELARWVAEHHSFAQRAETLIEHARRLVDTPPRNAAALT